MPRTPRLRATPPVKHALKSSDNVDNIDTSTRAMRAREGGDGEGEGEPRLRRLNRHAPMTEVQRQVVQDTFLDSFRVLGNISVACRAAGISRQSIYGWLEHDSAFSVRYHHAEQEAVDTLEAEAFRRAVRGVEKTVMSMGRVVMVNGKPLTERAYSDTLLLALLKAHHPLYRPETNRRIELTGAHGGPVPVAAAPVSDASDVKARLMAEIAKLTAARRQQ
jgi:hypothetical protein